MRANFISILQHRTVVALELSYNYFANTNQLSDFPAISHSYSSFAPVVVSFVIITSRLINEHVNWNIYSRYTGIPRDTLHIPDTIIFQLPINVHGMRNIHVNASRSMSSGGWLLILPQYSQLNCSDRSVVAVADIDFCKKVRGRPHYGRNPHKWKLMAQYN